MKRRTWGIDELNRCLNSDGNNDPDDCACFTPEELEQMHDGTNTHLDEFHEKKENENEN